jgi:hypothetical protein
VGRIPVLDSTNHNDKFFNLLALSAHTNWHQCQFLARRG